MIRHIVFFTADGADRIAEVREGLKALGTIPHASLFEVAENLRVDLYENAIDIVVYAEFADRAALDAFKADPTYAATTDAVKPLRALRFSADIESPAA